MAGGSVDLKKGGPRIPSAGVPAAEEPTLSIHGTKNRAVWPKEGMKKGRKKSGGSGVRKETI